MNGLGDPQCGRQDLVFIGNREEALGYDRNTVVEAVFSVLTNVAFVVPLRMLAARGRTIDVTSCVGLMVTSSCYHWCDTFRVSFLGMNGGNWHRLDNIFAIVSFVALVPMLMGRESKEGPSRSELDALRWSMLFVGLFFQELNPWNVLCTAAPIALAFLYFFYWSRYRAPFGHADRFKTKEFACAIVASTVGMVFFVFGLDEDRDAFRFFHGLWHLFNAASASLYLLALDPLLASSSRVHGSD